MNKVSAGSLDPCSWTLPRQIWIERLPCHASSERSVLHRRRTSRTSCVARPVMIFGQYTFAESMIGPPSQIEEMFRFAALHDIRTAVEVVPMDQVNGAMARVRSNKARYRMVLAA